MSFELDGKVCVVTGALGLIGKTLAGALAEAGGRVVITDLDHGACLDRAHAIGGGALGHGADIAKPESVASLLAAIVDRFGHIDVLVNNAAIDEKVEAGACPVVGTPGEALSVPASGDSRFEHYPVERFKRLMDVNVGGTFVCCQILGGAMAAAGAGSIINVASIYGVVAPDQSLYRRADGTQPFVKSAAYPTSKAAVLGLTRYLAAYWGHAGVRVNALTPGGVENGQDAGFIARYSARTPLGRMAKTADYAGAAVFLASDASSYMTGANLVVDGGFTVW